MGADTAAPPVQYPCEMCPLRARKGFRDFYPEELAFVSRFKKGELSVQKGATLLMEGSRNPHFYTVLSGWGFRYKLMPDGRRQIVNFAMPGDLVGLQGSLMEEMQHSVEALSSMLLCVFERKELYGLYRHFPRLAYDLTWMAAREEVMLDENLLSVGRRTAVERVAYLVASILDRAASSGLWPKNATEIPITQQQVADTLGLSLVHTNKIIRKLAERGLLKWVEGGCRVMDLKSLQRLARWEGSTLESRPFL